MDPLLIVNILSRWVHVMTAIVLLGGAIYVRWVLMPAAAELPPEEHDALRARLKQRWKKIVMLGITLLLVTGFYNFIVAIPAHKGQAVYHALMGIKILLAFAVFFIASVLVGRSAKFEPWRQNPKKWLGLLILLAAIVVGLGSVLKVSVSAKGSTVMVPPAATP
jgi:uncharacterized membrane protein